MCLCIKEIEQLHLAISPVICYKVVVFDKFTSSIYSSFRTDILQWGINYPRLNCGEQIESVWRDIWHCQIGAGFIHSYSKIDMAEFQKSIVKDATKLAISERYPTVKCDNLDARIAECTIPKGACYFEEPEFSEYASTSLNIYKLLE